jgi:hypothetical protein
MRQQVGPEGYIILVTPSVGDQLKSSWEVAITVKGIESRCELTTGEVASCTE